MVLFYLYILYKSCTANLSNFAINTFLIHTLLYWIWCLLILTFIHRISYFDQYKMYTPQANYLSIIHVCIVVLLNQLTIPYVALLCEPYLHMSDSFELWYIIVYFICTDITFYTTHRILHKFEYLYRNIHSIHHQWKYPYCFCALYAHILEFIFCNLFSVISGPLFLSLLGHSTPKILYYFWIGIATINTVNAHTGYSTSKYPKEYKLHIAHHVTTMNNYGVMGSTDYIGGTYRLVSIDK